MPNSNANLLSNKKLLNIAQINISVLEIIVSEIKEKNKSELQSASFHLESLDNLKFYLEKKLIN